MKFSLKTTSKLPNTIIDPTIKSESVSYHLFDTECLCTDRAMKKAQLLLTGQDVFERDESPGTNDGVNSDMINGSKSNIIPIPTRHL